MLGLERRWSAWLSRSRDYFGCEDILLEEALSDEFFQVPLEARAMDGLVPLDRHGRVVLFCSGMRGVILDESWTPNPALILDGVEVLIDGEPKRSKLLYRLVGSERTLWEDWERLSLVGRLPQFWSWAWVEVLCGDFDFPLWSLCFTEWFEKVFITSSNWM